MIEHSTLLPTSGKWTVFRRVPAPASGKDGHPWRAVNIWTRETKIFPTHTQAVRFADRMARTVEVTLHRAQYGETVIADKGLYSVHVHYRPRATDITLGGWDGVTVENRHLRDLALHLLACAQHWKENK